MTLSHTHVHHNRQLLSLISENSVYASVCLLNCVYIYSLSCRTIENARMFTHIQSIALCATLRLCVQMSFSFAYCVHADDDVERDSIIRTVIKSRPEIEHYNKSRYVDAQWSIIGVGQRRRADLSGHPPVASCISRRVLCVSLVESIVLLIANNCSTIRHGYSCFCFQKKKTGKKSYTNPLFSPFLAFSIHYELLTKRITKLNFLAPGGFAVRSKVICQKKWTHSLPGTTSVGGAIYFSAK